MVISYIFTPVSSCNRNLEFEFPCTNESLESIIAGLNPKQNNSVLAVGGSGDQAFALLEYVNQVVVVDTNPSQVEFIGKRKTLLSKGKFSDFLHTRKNMYPDRLEARNAYFKKEGRMDTIREKLKSLTIVWGDILSYEDENEREFDRVYLSNVLGWGINSSKEKELIKLRGLRKIAKILPKGGLIYAAMDSGNLFESDIPKFKGLRTTQYSPPFGVHFTILMPKELKLEYELTRKAREIEEIERRTLTRWAPTIYKKV